MQQTPLAGLTVAEFLHHHWQKRPLLVRGALPECRKLIRREELFELAAREDLE